MKTNAHGERDRAAGQTIVFGRVIIESFSMARRYGTPIAEAGPHVPLNLDQGNCRPALWLIATHACPRLRLSPVRCLVDRQTVVTAIENYPAEADEALQSLQLSAAAPVTLVALRPLAEGVRRSVAEFACDWFEKKGWTVSFVQALKARGVRVDSASGELRLEKGEVPDEPVDPDKSGKGRFDPLALQEFIPKAQAFRCRILSGAAQSIGSGCLVGPRLVLTAWHVVFDVHGSQTTPIKVLLSDGNEDDASESLAVASPATELELGNGFPKSDDEFEQKNDVALLRLKGFHGVRLGYAPLPDACRLSPTPIDICVLDFPWGENVGWAWGRASALPGITARLGHDAAADPGSSGGACFNLKRQLIGVHQGKWPPRKRLVPLSRVLDQIRPIVASDVAPRSVWSLDETPNGELVVGRDRFFEAVAEASKANSRARGVRIFRRDPAAQGTAGLGFSFRLLKRTLDLRPDSHRFLRVGFDQPSFDLLGVIRTSAVAENWGAPLTKAGPGAQGGEDDAETDLNARAMRLADQLNGAVAAHLQLNGAVAPRLLWVFFENPSSGMTEMERFALEAFVGAALIQPFLRVVLAGFETLSMPGETFATAAEAEEAAASGLIAETFGWLTKSDIEVFLQRALTALGAEQVPAVVTFLAKMAVKGVTAFNGQFGFYRPSDLEAISKKLTGILSEVVS